MASGQQLAEQNVRSFIAWTQSKSDEDFRAMATRGVLSRKEIAKECSFAKSALDQNPRIKQALRELETSLRSRGVLPIAVQRESDSSLMREPSQTRGAREAERLQHSEQENASLRAEVAELKRALEKYSVLKDALARTGRLPRC